jgi:CheY-like chemotaxis protein
MSHELRTPLNAIIGFSQLLELEGRLEPRQQGQIASVLKGARHLLELINEVLDLSRIEVGRLAISPESVALGAAVANAVTLVEPLAAERGVQLDTELTERTYAHADQSRLTQVLLNLLANAVKYNRPGGHVSISVGTGSAGRVRIAVADTGVGIEPALLARLFEPFDRRGAESSGVEGTGLGLALSKRLIDAMQGTIEVDSVPGEGTTFTVWLPAGAAPPLDGAPGSPEQPPASRGLDLPALRGRILYIEDNLSNLALMEAILGHESAIELTPAMQGTLGLELARKHIPDLIILDVHLPDINGGEVLRRLKADPATEPIPVIVLTADASHSQAERMRALGAAEFMTKPLDVVRFLDAVAAHLDR